MTNYDSRIPDDMAAEVMAEATRLHAEANKGYSFADLEQACLEANIPTEIIRKAIKNVKDKQVKEQIGNIVAQNRIKEQLQKALGVGIAFVIPVVALYGVRSTFSVFMEDKTVESSKVSPQQLANSPFKTLTVKSKKLEYLNDPTGLSIAVRNVGYGNVEAIVGTDNYESLAIESGKVGDFYEFKVIHDYRIKIIEFGQDSSVTFQIEQQEKKSYSPVKRLEKKVEQLEQESQEIKNQKLKVESERDDNQRQLKWKDSTIERLQEEIKQLQQKSKELKTQAKELQTQKKRLEAQRGGNLLQFDSKNSVIKRLEEQVLQLQQKSGELNAQIKILERE